MRPHLLLTTALVLAPLFAHAAPLRVGSPNEAVIEPPVPHPHETPCSVPLVQDAQFSDFTPATYSFTPPAACPGPWAKVVLNMSLSVNAGRQFDRTGLLTLNGVPLWFGTTAEPRASIAPKWNFSKDLTDYTALFETTQSGQLAIGNVVNSTYTGVITASATLNFYPVTATDPAPATADMVLPLNETTLDTSANVASIAPTAFPRNILSAKLDLYLQGQSNDEFWYLCVPGSLSATLESCGNTALREGEIAVDSTPAGVAPVFPWIFTGGIDPYLWQPIPGVQTLDFTPFRADLTPFAAVLSNGQAHSINVSVANANSYFEATGALLLFLDHGASTVTGALTRDTLVATPTVNTTDNIVTTATGTSGSVLTNDHRHFSITGTVTGSAGTTTTTVEQQTDFTNNQVFDITDTLYSQKANQQTTTTATTTTNGVPATTTTTWPLSVSYVYRVQNGGASKQTTAVAMKYIETDTANGQATLNLANTINTQDVLFFDTTGAVDGHKSQQETATYTRTGTSVPCFARTLTAANNLVSSVTTGCTAALPETAAR